MANDRDSTLDGDQITDRTIKQLELDLTNTPTDGQIVKINMPAGDMTAIDPTSVGAFRQSFTNADLSSGILTVTHNLAVQFILVRIYDNNDKVIEPDEYTATDSNILTVDLTTFGTLTGTWNISIVTGSLGSSSGSVIQDADGDTKVEVEKNADEDIVRITAFGTQEAQIDANGLKLKTGADVNEFSIDGTLAGNSDDAVPTEKAVKTFVDALSFANSFTQSFTNATLSSGILTVTHSLGVQYVNVTVYDNNQDSIMPDNIDATSTTVTTIDLTSFGTLTGTWNIRVVG